jgi:hypothetical protein
MFVQLATDPGAWNIIAWMLLLSAIGVLVLWAVTTLLLRAQANEVSDERTPRQS